MAVKSIDNAWSLSAGKGLSILKDGSVSEWLSITLTVRCKAREVCQSARTGMLAELNKELCEESCRTNNYEGWMGRMIPQGRRKFGKYWAV